MHEYRLANLESNYHPIQVKFMLNLTFLVLASKEFTLDTYEVRNS